MARVLVLGDLHFPAVHPGYLEWASGVGRAHKCDRVLAIGDVADLHCMTRFTREAGAPGIDEEYQQARTLAARAARLLSCVGPVRVCIGNHDDRLLRRLVDAGVPTALRPAFNAVWGVDWDWKYNHEIDGVWYAHGDTASGLDPAANLARDLGTSVVIGHHHSRCGLTWQTTEAGSRFAMNVGCGVDAEHPMLAYCRRSTRRPVLACAVVLDGEPRLLRMPGGATRGRGRTPGRRKAARKAVSA